MYDKDRKQIVDRREMLRVKIKSLAEEAKIIRKEEMRTYGQLHNELYLHRIGIVRATSRSAVLAYGFIRGRKHESMEPTRKTDPDWGEVKRLCSKYGPAGFVIPADLAKAA